MVDNPGFATRSSPCQTGLIKRSRARYDVWDGDRVEICAFSHCVHGQGLPALLINTSVDPRGHAGIHLHVLESHTQTGGTAQMFWIFTSALYVYQLREE
jgi:hypothetical protein